MRNHREQLLLYKNEKGERVQCSTLAKIQTKVLDGDYQRFSCVAISCLQYIEHEPYTASLRVSAAKRHGIGLRVAINGRDGHAACFLTNAQQVDELVMRLEKVKNDMFSPSLEIRK